MDEFILFFRMDITTEEAQPDPEQMKVYMEQWSEWISWISSKNRLSEGGNHLSNEGRVLRSNGVTTKGPYVEKMESVSGYIIITAADFDEAVVIARECPILKGEGTSVEVRKID